MTMNFRANERRAERVRAMPSAAENHCYNEPVAKVLIISLFWDNCRDFYSQDRPFSFRGTRTWCCSPRQRR